MSKNQSRSDNRLIVAGVMLGLFVLLIITLKFVDVQTIGPKGTAVGFAALNGGVHNVLGVHMAWYSITQVLGYMALLMAAGFGCLGLYQLVTRKSLFKVDVDLVLLGILYAIVILLYALFEVCVINYRPVILESQPEPSFPSSHTMLAIVILGTAMYQFRKRIRKQNIRVAANVACLIMMLLIVVGRLISGVHWFTDIFGSVLLGLALILIYNYVVDHYNKK